MSVYVLVHGGSVEGSVWNNVRDALEARGHRVFTPSLSDERRQLDLSRIAFRPYTDDLYAG